MTGVVQLTAVDKLSQAEAFGYSVLITVCYVGCLYARSSTRPQSGRNRNDEDVVVQRVLTIAVTTALLVFGLVPGILWWYEGLYETWFYAWQSLHMTLTIDGVLFEPLKCVLLTALLFTGPLVNFALFEHDLVWSSMVEDIRKGVSDIYGIRNYVIGPLTEELAFRSGILAVYLASGTSKTAMMFGTPLYFGVAHIHHAYESYVQLQDSEVLGDSQSNQILPLLLVSLVQFAYTSAFGWYAAYLFLNTGSVWSCVAVHALCNSLGLPDWTLDTPSKTRIYRVLLAVGLVGFFVVIYNARWSHAIV